jgi:hypothetical protein
LHRVGTLAAALASAAAMMLLGAPPVLSKVVLTRGTGTSSEIDAQVNLQRQNLLLGVGFLTITDTPGGFSGSSPLFNFTINFVPRFGPDPVVATVGALGNQQNNDIFGFGIGVSAQDIIAVGASETGPTDRFTRSSIRWRPTRHRTLARLVGHQPLRLALASATTPRRSLVPAIWAVWAARGTPSASGLMA